MLSFRPFLNSCFKKKFQEKKWAGRVIIKNGQLGPVETFEFLSERYNSRAESQRLSSIYNKNVEGHVEGYLSSQGGGGQGNSKAI